MRKMETSDNENWCLEDTLDYSINGKHNAASKIKLSKDGLLLFVKSPRQYKRYMKLDDGIVINTSDIVGYARNKSQLDINAYPNNNKRKRRRQRCIINITFPTSGENGENKSRKWEDALQNILNTTWFQCELDKLSDLIFDFSFELT